MIIHCRGLRWKTIWYQLGRLHSPDHHPVLLTVLIEPTHIVALRENGLSSWCSGSFCCIFCLSRSKQTYIKKTIVLIYFSILWIAKIHNNLTGSIVSSSRTVRAFAAAFSLASFLFFPTPSGYGLPSTTALTVNLQTNEQKRCSNDAVRSSLRHESASQVSGPYRPPWKLVPKYDSLYYNTVRCVLTIMLAEMCFYYLIS